MHLCMLQFGREQKLSGSRLDPVGAETAGLGGSLAELVGGRDRLLPRQG